MKRLNWNWVRNQIKMAKSLLVHLLLVSAYLFSAVLAGIPSLFMARHCFPASTLDHTVQVPITFWLTQSYSNSNILQKESPVGSVKLMHWLPWDQRPHLTYQAMAMGKGWQSQVVWTCLSRFTFQHGLHRGQFPKRSEDCISTYSVLL